MGQHTWFYKDKNLYEEQQKIYEKFDQYDEGIIWLEDEEIWDLERRDNELDKLNNTPYHDIFRTGKREADGSYTLDVITSKKECCKRIEENKDCVTLFDDSKKLLDKFWEEYPNGIIDFG